MRSLVCARCGSQRVWAGTLCWACHRDNSVEMRVDSQSRQARWERAIVLVIVSLGGAAAFAQYSALAAVASPVVFGVAAYAIDRRHLRGPELPAVPEARLLPPRT